MTEIEDELPVVEPVALALTRPPMKFGVRYEVFALNGMIAIVFFIATSAIIVAPIVFVIGHAIAAYLCQRDIHMFHILEVLASHRRAVANQGFWGARSYSP